MKERAFKKKKKIVSYARELIISHLYERKNRGKKKNSS